MKIKPQHINIIKDFSGVMILIGMLLLGTALWRTDPLSVDLPTMFATPSWQHPLGADELGRDVLVRLLGGGLLSVFVGVCVLMLTGTIGTIVGVWGGYKGGIADVLLMRLTDIFLSFPGILMAIAFAALAGPGVSNVVLALGLMGWVGFARLARVQTLRLRGEEFVQAATLSGVQTGTMLWRYILPNIAAPLIVEGVFVAAGAMLSEAGLSFLGIGIQPPEPSLGAMLREGARYMLMAPHLVLAPGALLMLLVLTLNRAGDKLRDRLDVRTRM